MIYLTSLFSWTSLLRIEAFLLKREQQIADQSQSDGEDIVLQDAAFGTAETTILKNMTTVFRARSLTAIIGRVGCGRSTLVHALLSEVDLLQGALSFPVNATVGLAVQDPWLRPGETIRANITSLHAYNPSWYKQVVRACSLDTDFKVFADGDQQACEGLSGGQKARIALARTVYAEPDVVILDDVFSALE